VVLPAFRVQAFGTAAPPLTTSTSFSVGVDIVGVGKAPGVAAEAVGASLGEAVGASLGEADATGLGTGSAVAEAGAATGAALPVGGTAGVPVAIGPLPVQAASNGTTRPRMTTRLEAPPNVGVGQGLPDSADDARSDPWAALHFAANSPGVIDRAARA
jgi:hypothetical protein